MKLSQIIYKINKIMLNLIKFNMKSFFIMTPKNFVLKFCQL